MSAVCKREGCGKKVSARGFCSHHYKMQNRCMVNERRFELRRRYKDEWPPRWNNREAFVSDVGPQPGPKYRLLKKDRSKPISKTNIHWVAPLPIRAKATGRTHTGYNAEHHRFRKYGLYPDDYDRMLEEQDGVCAICKTLPPRRAGPTKVAILVVDHDHDTNKVRGLLCTGCNQGIGNFLENEDSLQSAVAYLRRHNGKR